MPDPTPEFSFVVPLHNTGELLRPLLGAFRAEAMTLRDSWELVLVDDGSTDGTTQAAREQLLGFPASVTLVELTRNFGEHAAVLEGCGHLSTLEAPREVAGVLHEWLARVDAAEAARGAHAVSGPAQQHVQ